MNNKGRKFYINSFVNADSFYANFRNTTFQKISIPHFLYEQYILTCLIRNLFNTHFSYETKAVLTKNLVYYGAALSEIN